MNILSNYEGSSIDILRYNNVENSAYLSLKKENDSYSQYYNFIIDNNQNKDGYVYIQNIKLSKYYEKNSVFFPYKRIESSNEWQRIDNNSFSIADNMLVIKIKPNEKFEISLVPRYTKEHLERFLDTIKNFKYIKISNNIIPKIELGNNNLPTIFVIGRQHPGETLSSFFIEGMINSIIQNNELLAKYHFVFYPIVNTIGVKNGSHRYVNGIDFNRVWQSNKAPKEIKFIKEELRLYSLLYFIDVHNDEITQMDYIRVSGNLNKNNVSGLTVLKSMSPFYRLLRAIIKQKKLINLSCKTAREYVKKYYGCTSILIELSMKENYKNSFLKGEKFILELLEDKENQNGK